MSFPSSSFFHELQRDMNKNFTALKNRNIKKIPPSRILASVLLLSKSIIIAKNECLWEKNGFLGSNRISPVYLFALLCFALVLLAQMYVSYISDDKITDYGRDFLPIQHLCFSCFIAIILDLFRPLR